MIRRSQVFVIYLLLFFAAGDLRADKEREAEAVAGCVFYLIAIPVVYYTGLYLPVQRGFTSLGHTISGFTQPKVTVHHTHTTIVHSTVAAPSGGSPAGASAAPSPPPEQPGWRVTQMRLAQRLGVNVPEGRVAEFIAVRIATLVDKMRLNVTPVLREELDQLRATATRIKITAEEGHDLDAATLASFIELYVNLDRLMPQFSPLLSDPVNREAAQELMALHEEMRDRLR